MKLTVNGETVQTNVRTVKKLLNAYEIESSGNQKGLAVAVNDSVIPKEQWEDHRLNDEDRIEIIHATQGG